LLDERSGGDLAVTSSVQWLAADPSGTPPSEAWNTFGSYGVLGVAVLAMGWLVYRILNQLWARSGAELAREVARGDRLEAEGRALNTTMRDQAIPALLAAADALTKATALLREQQREREYALRHKDGDNR
jgi:hypothetical protein